MSHLDPAQAEPPRGRHRARRGAAREPAATPEPVPHPDLDPDPYGWDRAADAWGDPDPEQLRDRAAYREHGDLRDRGHPQAGSPSAYPGVAGLEDGRPGHRMPPVEPATGRPGSWARRHRATAGAGPSTDAGPLTDPVSAIGEPTAELPAQPPSTGRAGRNLPAAIGVGALLGAAVLSSLFFWRPAFLAVVVAAGSIGIWEMVQAVRASGARPPLGPLLTGGLVMSGLAWFAGPDALAVGLLLTVLATMVWRLADGPAGYHRDVTAATLISVYVPFLLGFAAMLGSAADGQWRVLATLAAVVLSDTGGYVAGVFFGRRPMAPTISPKKSWEGLAGSLLAAAVGESVLLYLLFDVAWWWGLVFGVSLSVAAVLGDLAESLLKRDLGVKDMSTLLPGHGGLMDRLDSILLAVPVAYLLLSVLAPAAT
ncbi:MAG TPA: phosphatidate cytidylyltransferase [Micromonosporaceae bacterium]|nr:phosphatidate cytidylyltransferase [Micromonosporaceae bacterium]